MKERILIFAWLAGLIFAPIRVEGFSKSTATPAITTTSPWLILLPFALDGITNLIDSRTQEQSHAYRADIFTTHREEGEWEPGEYSKEALADFRAQREAFKKMRRAQTAALLNSLPSTLNTGISAKYGSKPSRGGGETKQFAEKLDGSLAGDEKSLVKDRRVSPERSGNPERVGRFDERNVGGVRSNRTDQPQGRELSRPAGTDNRIGILLVVIFFLVIGVIYNKLYK